MRRTQKARRKTENTEQEKREKGEKKGVENIDARAITLEARLKLRYEIRCEIHAHADDADMREQRRTGKAAGEAKNVLIKNKQCRLSSKRHRIGLFVGTKKEITAWAGVHIARVAVKTQIHVIIVGQEH
jgi:hypothetical protein